jgi:hypothetical protein
LKGFIYLAEAATRNSNNTVSVLNGGVFVAQFAELPASIFLNIVMQVISEGDPAGTHGIMVSVMPPDGGGNIQILPTTVGDWESKDFQVLNATRPFSIKAEKYGVHEFTLAVDGKSLWTCGLVVAPPYKGKKE